MDRLRGCIEELVKFTLESHINRVLDFDLGLSQEFCSNLLKYDSAHVSLANADAGDIFEGVPPYPLYKRLALALHQSIVSGAFCDRQNKMVLPTFEDISMKPKAEWNQLIMDKGHQLINIMNKIIFELHVQESFSHLKDGLKGVEGRCAIREYSSIEPGAMILCNKCLVLEVQNVHRYASFMEMLEAEDIDKVLPEVKTVEEGLQMYRKFYTEEEERSKGVLAICVSKLAAQPFILLASILSGLNYGGVQSLLGLAHTTGTISDALPPPKSTLLSSFMLPYNPNVKGSTLTVGARALAKHADRSSNRHWGVLKGSDSSKNNHAVDIISDLIAHSCWLNVHVVQPHGAVFEIRRAQGYGARWSNHGTKFIGFLEPYMDDGHSKGWKH
ncbi:hypothetical protein SLA2020_093850 [Shorea laevis]